MFTIWCDFMHFPTYFEKWLNVELRKFTEETKKWMKKKLDLKNYKEELIGERDALKIQLSALNQGDITFTYLNLLNHKFILVFPIFLVWCPSPREWQC